MTEPHDAPPRPAGRTPTAMPEPAPGGGGDGEGGGESGKATFAFVALMAALGAEGGTLRLTAINDYAVEIPMADAVPGAALLAYELDGQPMSVRQKGPVWLVYPYDSDGKWRTESVYARSVWQLNRIEVRD